MALYLMLCGPTHTTKEPIRFLLAPDADADQIRTALDGAGPGEFVNVPVVLEDQADTNVLRVQPHRYGAWLVYQAETEPGGRTPQRAVRGHQPGIEEAAEGLQQLQQLGERFRRGQGGKG